VLIDSEMISAHMLIEELARLGVAIDLDYTARHFPGRSYPTVRAQIRHEFNLDLPTDFEDRYRDRLLETLRFDINIMTGVLDVLDQLAVPCCVATSSSPRRVDRSLRLTGLDQRMEGRIFTASQVSRGKPAPGLGPGIDLARAVAPAAAAELERVLRMQPRCPRSAVV
jgi:beta-phosphoglucomutase-like phosphatase (HAD superfamily)